MLRENDMPKGDKQIRDFGNIFLLMAAVLGVLVVFAGCEQKKTRSCVSAAAPCQAEKSTVLGTPCGGHLTAKKDGGFAELFNGKDLTNWRGSTENYIVEDGKIVCLEHGVGNIYTDGQYSDFILRFEFKLTPGANNGLGIRTPIPSHAAYDAMEIQILDDTAEKHKKLKPYQFHGSIYGVVPARRGHLKPVGEWNFQEVIAKGRQITVNLNGATIVDADLDEVSTPETMDGKDHPGLKRERGHIAFLGHRSRVEFRNIRIKELE